MTQPKNSPVKEDYLCQVPAVDQACRVLFSLAEEPDRGLLLTEICQRVGIAASKGHNILKTLHHYKLVTKNPKDKSYSLGFSLVSLSRALLFMDGASVAAGANLSELSKKTGSTVFFGLIDGYQLCIVDKWQPERRYGFYVQKGRRLPLTMGAHGKAIVAHMSPNEQEQILNKEALLFHGLNFESALETDALKQELEACRLRGYAVDIGEIQKDSIGIAAPVFGAQNRVIGALVVLGLFSHENIPEFGGHVVQTARKISVDIGADIHVEPMKREVNKEKNNRQASQVDSAALFARGVQIIRFVSFEKPVC